MRQLSSILYHAMELYVTRQTWPGRLLDRLRNFCLVCVFFG